MTRLEVAGCVEEESEASVAERKLVDSLIEELERLPGQQSVALRAVWIADDPTASARDLAGAVRADPILTARVMRLANSAYYGLCGRVSNVDFAVTVVGFATVRAMAAASASGLFAAGERVAPDGFWEHAVAVATASATLAPRLGVRAPDAFSMGLLHDLGSALLFRSDPERFDAAVAEAQSGTPLGIIERREFGMSHDVAAARVFAAWRFGDDLVRAVAKHHGLVDSSASNELRVLVAAEAIAARLPGAPRSELTRGPDAGLAALDLSLPEAAALAGQVSKDAEELLRAFRM